MLPPSKCAMRPMGSICTFLYSVCSIDSVKPLDCNQFLCFALNHRDLKSDRAALSIASYSWTCSSVKCAYSLCHLPATGLPFLPSKLTL